MVDHRRLLHLLILIKKNVTEGKLTLVDHDRIKRHNDGLKIKLPIPKNQHVGQTPYFTGSSICNTLPLNIREMDLANIKKEVKNRLKNNLINPII